MNLIPASYDLKVAVAFAYVATLAVRQTFAAYSKTKDEKQMEVEQTRKIHPTNSKTKLNASLQGAQMGMRSQTKTKRC